MMDRDQLLDEALYTAEKYRDEGYSLTLRQLYYALVSEALIPNSQQSYKRLGDVVGKARLDGVFDMDLLIDRGREAKHSKHIICALNIEDAEQAAFEEVRNIPGWAIGVDPWFAQPKHVSVWIEKDALSGVFQDPCEALGVGLFACKGYPSHSALWQWLQGLEQATVESQGVQEDDLGKEGVPLCIQEAIILYFGDHDPDGWQIPRSAEDTLNRLVEVYRLNVPPIRFERVALNMAQIRKYGPPPFPAKESSSRFAAYEKEHRTTDAWELDALKPQVLQQLLKDNVALHWDPEVSKYWQAWAQESRARFKDRIMTPGWMAKALAKGGV
jgi:hypothetical protein